MMEIKKCPHCGSKASLIMQGNTGPSWLHFVRCDDCGSEGPKNSRSNRGDFTSEEVDLCDELAADGWNSRIEQDSITIDRWFKEATEQRSRAELAEAQRDELADALQAIKRAMAYAGHLQ